MSRKRARYDAYFGNRRKRGPGAPGARGSGHRLLPVLRAPKLSVLETKLDRLGVPIQRFRQFRSSERMNVQPDSGKCRWYCVPHTMEYGNTMSITNVAGVGTQQEVIKHTPNSGDLFDIYRNITAGLGAGGTLGHDPRQTMGLDGINVTGGDIRYIPGAVGQQDTTTDNKLWRQIPVVYRITKPGMDYTQRTSITYDNISSLDAFVEVYCLRYRRPRSIQSYSAGNYMLGEDEPLNQLMESGALLQAPIVWGHATTPNPGTDFCPAGITASFYPNPIFGGSMLKLYADAVLFQRSPYYETIGGVSSLSAREGMFHAVDLGPGKEGGFVNATGLGTYSTQETRDQVVCHPRVDPLRVTPPTRSTAQLGITMTRVRAAQRIKPGHSSKFDIPADGTRWWDYSKSPQGQKSQDGPSSVTFGSTDVSDCVVYCFRVWGDMIHSKVEPGATGAETDFTTGSTSVTFQTQRVIWARVRHRYNSIVNPQLLQFDDNVALENQEQINEEMGAPEIVKIAGDGVP